MRKAWANKYRIKSGIQPNKFVWAEYNARARFNSDLGDQMRTDQNNYINNRVMKLFGIDVSRFYPEEGEEGVRKLIKGLQDNGASIERNICLLNGVAVKIYLFFNAKWDNCFFIKSDLVESKLYKSIRYGSRKVAYRAYHRNQIIYREYSPLQEKLAREAAEKESIEQMLRRKEQIKQVQEKMRLEKEAKEQKERATKALMPWLKCLGMTQLPYDYKTLQKYYRKALFRVHPDHGGSSAETQRVIDAFDRLKKLFGL